VTTPPATTPAAPAVKPRTTEYQEIKIVSHSNLFYWWPVWAIGFALGLWSLVDQHVMAIVPKGTTAEHGRLVDGHEGKRDVLVLPEKKSLDNERGTDQPVKPHLHISTSKSNGVFFIIVLLLVIVVTNVPLRGLWSVVVLVTIILLSIIFHLAEWWEPILDALNRLHVYINAAGYLVFSIVLFIAWAIVFFLFDQQIYMVFTPGQLRVREEIGGGESAYDTAGMVIQKQRNDLFRHWILGLGSGDLVVTTVGATAHHFNLPNVLFVGHKVHLLEDMLREKPVVQG
jgi:hypothetical protein